MTDAHPAPPARTDARLLVTAAVALGGAAVVAAGTVLQLWFAPFVVGLALGAFTRLRHGRALIAALVSAAAAVGGWAMPLAWRALVGDRWLTWPAPPPRSPVSLPRTLLIFVTLLVALLQGLVGVWLGRAVLGLTRFAG